ncbi:hypothetical protein QBC40DRAFT_338702 [Triangularia verruculosa]|uniref:Lytic polysaccharide monooxygenase n=1 Tax=Triangularia verruculosa TaxID=2587418 RepID=A0AAN6XQK6_9PEZI|nr:hypothetical protein QBC40DRAFT_338702 [Triangularia verruculosa]
MKSQLTTGLTSLILALTQPFLTTAHMSITSPAPLGSLSNANMQFGDIDHNLRSPISGLDFPCGPNFDLYSRTPQGNPVAAWSAGSTQSFTMDGGATHNGGSCQASLSIDKGKTFKVLRSYEGGCPLAESYQFTLPSDVPATKKAIFAWTWFNQLGNREMYMNCAVVDIVGGDGKGGGKGGWSRKPEVFKANVGNGCSTVERFDVLFPNPGDDVVKGGEGRFAAPVGECGETVNRGGSGGAGSNGGESTLPGAGTSAGNAAGNGSGNDDTPAASSPEPSSTSASLGAVPTTMTTSSREPKGTWTVTRTFTLVYY